VGGSVSGADDGSGGGPDWGPLERAIAGEVAVPGSPAFDRLPQPFNARYHDLLPRAVVLCAAPADVVETLAFLSAHGLEPTIRSGGHCFAGHSSTSGVVVDVSAMRAVSIDGDLATVGAGARLGAVYDSLAADGRTIPGGSCPPVGIAGLTLGGGLGILGRSYGVTSDRLVAAEVVLADGRVVVCDEHHESDLFWALRGAGAGNFGVVTSLVFRTVPAPDVTNVHLSWPFSDAVAVIGGWQAWAPFGPDELAASLKVTAAAEVDRPPGVDVYAAVRGSEGDAATLADQLAARVGRDPTAVARRRMSFAETRRFWAQLGAVDLASAIPEPDDETVPRHLVARTEFFRRPLPTDTIAALVAHLAAGRTSGEERELDFMPWGGAYNRVPPDATAFVHREEHFQLKHAAVLDPEVPATAKAAAHRWVGRSWSTVHPWGSGRAFQNFADRDLENWAEAYYGTNYPRLVRVKAQYDPGNEFHADQSLLV
jgi:FAD/FMN-containing dehydrogenase